MRSKEITILGIESSCDDTSAAIIRDGVILSNVVAGQKVHEEYGGVVPELASRAHQQNIIPVVDLALKRAAVSKDEISAVAFTSGPGFLQMEVIGQTIDDAAGEAFDKCAKVMGLPYPGGPHVDRLAKTGNPLKFEFSKPKMPDLNYSFSGLKTNFLYFLRDNLKENENFIQENLNDLCASLQYTIIEILMNKLKRAAKETGIKEIAVAGGVSANSGLRNSLRENAEKYRWNLVIPKFEYTMDNAAMIAITGYFKYLNNEFADQGVVPFARTQIDTKRDEAQTVL